ncbi:MAG: HD domain-containing protein, partial [Candidatus Hodarchaeota archaeon]
MHKIFIRLPESYGERKIRMANVFRSSLYLPVATTIKIPEYTNVPIPENWLKLIDCREFQRLKKVRQLSTVIWVYPGAEHNRFEHSLGVYHTARQTLQNLLRDDRVFSMLDERALDIFLASSILHDLGHYPLSHVIEEIIKFEPYKSGNHLRRFTHENILNEFVEYRDSELKRVLTSLFTADEIFIIRDLVSSGYDEIKAKRGNNWAFLKSLIDGLVDIDKIDYLEGDSIHCGVPYGKGYDKFRIISALTLNEQGDHVAVSEKGRASLELLLLCRYTMFTEVYWHHTTRAVVAMLKRAFWDLLGDDPQSVDSDFLKGYEDRNIHKCILGENVWTENPYYYTDDEALWFLKSYASSRGKKVAEKLLNAIIQGRYYQGVREDGLYKRILTFPYVAEDSLERRSREIIDLVKKITLYIYSRDWRKFTLGVVREIKRNTGISDLKEHEIIFDVAKKEERFDLQIFYPKRNIYDDIRNASPIIKQLMVLFEKDANRHIRIFCHPKHFTELSKQRNKI